LYNNETVFPETQVRSIIRNAFIAKRLVRRRHAQF
jgi:hypothetical protein